MKEIVALAAAAGHVLPEAIIDTMINLDPMDLYLKPSMQRDLEKSTLSGTQPGSKVANE